MPPESAPDHRRDAAIAATAEPQSDAMLLALLLQRGCRPDVAARIARRLLARFDGLRGIAGASDAELLSIPEIGSSRLAVLRALPEFARRYYEASLVAGQAIKSPADTEAYLRARLRDLRYEVFGCVFLDNRHRVLCFTELFRGTIDGTSVYPREVLMEALRVNAAAVILAHNHPSGVAEPSHADESITRRLKAALGLVDIRLLDHLIVGDTTSTSLASRGLL